MLGNPAVPRMLRSLGTIRRSEVGGYTGSTVEHLRGAETRNV